MRQHPLVTSALHVTMKPETLVPDCISNPAPELPTTLRISTSTPTSFVTPYCRGEDERRGGVANKGAHAGKRTGTLQEEKNPVKQGKTSVVRCVLAT